MPIHFVGKFMSNVKIYLITNEKFGLNPQDQDDDLLDDDCSEEEDHDVGVDDGKVIQEPGTSAAAPPHGVSTRKRMKKLQVLN